MDPLLGVALAVVLTAAFVESVAVPLPMTVVVAPAVYQFPEGALWFVIAATVGSAGGAVGGSAVGRWRGRHAVRRVVDDERFAWSERVYTAHGTFGLFLGAIIPFPYAPFTISSGIYGTDYRSVFLVTALAKGIKYSIVAVGVVWLTAFDPTMAFVTLGVGLLAGYVVWNYTLRDRLYGLLTPTDEGT